MLDDALDEDDEVMTVTLSNASVPLAGGGVALTATGTIKDDDPPPQLSIADAAVTEDDGAMGFEVRLEPASGRAVVVTMRPQTQPPRPVRTTPRSAAC